MERYAALPYREKRELKMNQLNQLRKEMNAPLNSLRHQLNKDVIKEVFFKRMKHQTLMDQEYQKILADNNIEVVA